MIIGCIINITAYQYLKKIKRMYSNFILFYFFFVNSFTNLILARMVNFKRKLQTKKRIITNSKLTKNTRNIPKFCRNFFLFLEFFKNLLIMQLHLKK